MTEVRRAIKPIAHPVQRLQVELVVRLDRNEAHVLALHRLSDGLGIQEVVLVGLHKRLHELRRDQLHIMTLLLATHDRGSVLRNRLPARSGSLHVRRERDQLLLGELLLQQHLAVIAKRTR